MSRLRVIGSLFTLAAITLLVTGQTTKRNIAEDVQQFWIDFRTAVISRDYPKIVLLTNFPFETRGSMDFDPIVKRDKKWFLNELPALLESSSGLSIDHSPNELATQRDVVKKTARIEPSDFIDQKGFSQFRIGDFVFRKVKGSWRFCFCYVES